MRKTIDGYRIVHSPKLLGYGSKYRGGKVICVEVYDGHAFLVTLQYKTKKVKIVIWA